MSDAAVQPGDRATAVAPGPLGLTDRLLASSRDCIKVLDADGRLLSINEAGCALMEVADAAPLLGTRWPEWWPDEGRAAAEAALERARAGEAQPAYEAFAPSLSGRPKWWEVTVTPVAGEGDGEGRVLVISRDVTERRRTESLMRGQNRALELIASGAPLADVLACVAGIIEEQAGGAAAAIILLTDRAGTCLRVGAPGSFSEAFVRRVDGLAVRQGLGTCADAAARRVEVETHDLAAAPGWSAMAHLPAAEGLKAAWAVPILSPAGEVLGTIGTFFRENRGPTERERGVVQVLARTAALAIERRAAEEGARRDRERAELVVRGANVGVWYCTLPFDRLVWDEKVKEHFHLPPDAEVTIGTFYERIHPEDRERTRAAIADSVERRAPYDIDYRTVSPDGASVKWVRAMGRAYYDDAGRLVRFDGVTLDVTERRAAEDALRDSAESLRRHVDALAALNTINLTLASSDDTAAIVQTATDVATRLTRAAFGAFFYNVLNERGESYMLYTLSGVPRSAFERFPMPRNTHVFAPTFNGEGVVRSDDITKDPRYGRNPPHRGMPEGHLPVRSYLAVPVHSRDGGVIGGLFFGHPGTGVFDEEAERHAVGVAAQAAVALDNARLYTDLRRSEERYKLAARATSDAIWDWDLATGRIGWNQAVAQLFGHADAPAGTTAAWRLERVHPDDLGRVAEGLRAAADGEGGDAWSAEYRFQRADGSWADVFDRGTVLRDAGGKPLRMVGAMLDLSDRKRAERERQDLLESERAARAAAERAGRLKDEFLAVLSHELRTPLNAILGWTHLLRKGAADPEKVARGVEVIERNARAQSQLIADLLDVSRITAGKLRLDARAVDLPAVVGAAVEAVRPAADANGVLVHTELGAVGGEVRGDAARLQQVVWNLVSNAVKFTPRGGRVDVALGGAGGSAVVRVSDTGRGIAPEFLPFVFERFRQADSSAAREHGGLGLGLALVRQLVEMHGGRVAAASAGPGLGATFTVELPLAQAPAPDAGRSPEPEGAGDAGALALRLEGLRVLVVDDEPDALDVVRRVLEEHGVEAVAATSAEQGLAALEGGRFDALVSDIGMPGQDGYAFIAEARRRGVRAPAAALTAFARSEDRTRALLAGYQAHVTKPVEAAELLATVASLAGRTA